MALVNASGSRLGRMSANGSVLSNDASTQITVLTEDQFAIQVYTGEYADNNFINGVRVTLLDLKNKDAKPITFTVQVGVGVKGFLDFWARFIGGINFRLLLVMSGDEKSTISGTASINFTVGVTLLVLTLSKEVYNKSNIKLFDDVPLSNAMPLLQQYAVKPNAPEEVVPASQEPLSYPALNQSVRFAAYISDSDAGPNNAKVVTVGNQQ